MMRKPLGRGLDALIGTAAAGIEIGADIDSGAGGAQFKLAPVASIAPGPFQPRINFDQERLAELTRAIQSQGIIEPLVVRRIGATEPDAPRYELIAGERRLRAARLAELTVVPVIVRELDDRAALEMSLVENLLREDLNPIEEGQGFARLNREFALTHDEIATRIGKSRSYVSNIIRLIELPPEVLEMIGRGELTGGQVRPLLALSSPEAQLAEARKIAEARITSRQAEAIASARRAGRHGAGARGPARADDPNLLALGEAIQRALKRKVRIVRRRGSRPGRIELEFYNDEDLSGLARALTTATRPPSHISQ